MGETTRKWDREQESEERDDKGAGRRPPSRFFPNLWLANQNLWLLFGYAAKLR